MDEFEILFALAIFGTFVWVVMKYTKSTVPPSLRSAWGDIKPKSSLAIGL